MASSSMLSHYSLSQLEDVLKATSNQPRKVLPVHEETTRLPHNCGQAYTAPQLHPGKIHEVRVTAIHEGTKKFVIQVKGSGVVRQELHSLLDKVQLQPLRSYTRGSPCLVMFHKNDTPRIYRGLIALHASQKCHIYFVDYGNMEVIDLGDLYKIPGELVSIKLQAYRVFLSNLGELEKMEGCTNAFTTLVTSKSLQFKCQVVEPPQGIVMFDQIGRNIKDLINFLLVNAPSKELSSAQIEKRLGGSTYLSRYQYGEKVVSEKQTIEQNEKLFVTFVHSVGKFFGQLERMSMKSLNKLQSELMKAYSLPHPHQPLLYSDGTPHTGDAAVVKWSGDDHYYRVMIHEEYSNDVVVWFLDYGNVQIVSKNEVLAPLRNLPFFNQPAFGIFCQVHPPVTASLSEAQWTALLLDKSVHVEIAGCQNNLYSVKFTEDPDNKQIREVLYSPPSPPSRPVQAKVEKEEQIYVSHIESARFIWVQFQFHETILFDIQHLLETENKVDDAENPLIVGPVYAVEHPEYGTWYRGRLKSIGANQVEVHFIDYGDLHLVPTAALRPCPDEIKYLPSFAFRCALNVPLDLKCHDELIFAFLTTATDSVLTAVFDGCQDDVRLIGSLKHRDQDLIELIRKEHEKCTQPEASGQSSDTEEQTLLSEDIFKDDTPTPQMDANKQNEENDSLMEHELDSITDPSDSLLCQPSVQVVPAQPETMPPKAIEPVVVMPNSVPSVPSVFFPPITTELAGTEPRTDEDVDLESVLGIDAEDQQEEQFEDLDPPVESATGEKPHEYAEKAVDQLVLGRTLSVHQDILECIINPMIIVLIIFCLSMILKL